MTHSHQNPGFFPNLVSVVFFIAIMVGLFFAFTTVYPSYIARFQAEKEPSPNSDVSTDIAPFVRGILSGQNSARIMAKVSSEPLNALNLIGFQHGIEAALITAKDWYDLDRQLFKIRGISTGVSVALQESKAVSGRSTLEYQIKLTDDIQTALSVNLDDVLSANPEKRQQVLEEHLKSLKRLSFEAQIELGNTQRVIDEMTAIIEENTALSDQFGENGSIQKNLKPFLEARTKVEEAKIRLNTTGQVLKKLQALSNSLTQLITGIENNSEALSKGVKIAPVPGANLPLFKE